MKLILTRHGETELNLKGIMQGHLPGKLTKNGINQAEKLALRLKNEKIAFNAGSLSDSIVMLRKDYINLAKPSIFNFSVQE